MKKEKVLKQAKGKKVNKLTDLLGKYSIGINNFRREDIYYDYLGEKYKIEKK